MSLRNGISLLSTSNRDHDFNHDYDYDYEDRDASLFGIILSPLPTSSFTSNARSFSTSSSANTTTTNQPQPLTQPKALQTIIPTSLLDRIKSPTLWFDDGNIVLVARNTAFRIYRGLIASQSTVFSDMLVSSCASADETFDGCPTVQLSDSPEDLTHFLRALVPCSQKR